MDLYKVLALAQFFLIFKNYTLLKKLKGGASAYADDIK